VRGFLFPAPASNVTWVHSWNPAGGLASDTRHGDDYAWTGAYNAARPYTTNGLNQYATTGQPNAAGSVAFTYDANGNLASEATWNGTAYIVSTSYTYDIENRLIAMSGSRTAALRYDPLGRLYEVAAPSATTRFLYDGDALIAEYNTTGTMLRRHVHWPGADVPMTTYEGSGFGTVRQLFADRQGSIAAIADGNGTRLSVNSYDEYGIPAAGNTGRFQYTGQIWLPELGMYHYKARIYSPTLGRFLQTDPVGYDDQFNLYAYVGNDPVNGVDPSGQEGLNLLDYMRRTERIVNEARSRSYTNSRVPSAMIQSVRTGLELVKQSALQTGSSARDIAPVGIVSRVLHVASALITYNNLRQEGHSAVASGAGAVAKEATGVTIGAAIGTFVAPGLGTVIGGVAGYAIGELTGIPRAVGNLTADAVDEIASGVNGLAHEANERLHPNRRGDDSYDQLEDPR
jgi:RHS repeat-associated protein